MTPDSPTEAEPVPDPHTRTLAAGVLTFEVEHRGGDAALLTIRVRGTEDRYEYLRFDVFADGPHYHYFPRRADGTPDSKVFAFDATVNGDMLPWAVRSLRYRLPQMLEAASGGALVSQLDMNEIGPVLDQVIGAAEAGQ